MTVKANKERVDAARIRAAAIIAPFWAVLRVPDHGSVTFAADGTAFVELTLEIRPEKA